jgi:hypothetical protein
MSEQQLVSNLAYACIASWRGSGSRRRPHHPLQETAVALFRLANARVKFSLIKEPRLVTLSTMVPHGHLILPVTDTTYLVEDGAKGLRGNGGYWIDHRGDKVDIPSIPKRTSPEYAAWNQGYLAWIAQQGENECRASRIAYNLSRVSDLQRKMPLIHVTTCLYILEYDREEIARGEKNLLAERLLSLHHQFGGNVHWQVRVWSVTTIRIKRAGNSSFDTSLG